MYAAARLNLITKTRRKHYANVSVEPQDLPATQISKTDLYNILRPLLIFGRLIGMVPFGGLFQKDLSRVTFSRTSGKAILAGLISISISSNIIVALMNLVFENHKTLPEVVWTSRPIIFQFIGIFGYCYMALKGDKLIQLMQQWRSMSLTFEGEDKNLRRDATIIFVGVYTSAILENALQQAIQMSLLDSRARFKPAVILNGTLEDETPGLWKEYYLVHTQPKWITFVPYNFVLSFFIFFWNKCCLYGWNFLDILIIIISRAIFYQFKLLAAHTNNNIVLALSDVRQKILVSGWRQWQAVTKDFETLYMLVENVKKFLSPVVFVSYGINLYFVIIHLHMGITPVKDTDSPAATEVYRTWAFIHILMRTFLVTLYSSRIADYSDEFVRLYRKCPTECYSDKVRRTERFAKSTKCCLTGLNCFYVTKPFMLSLVGVVFTFEIVLLQSSGYGHLWGVSVPS